MATVGVKELIIQTIQNLNTTLKKQTTQNTAKQNFIWRRSEYD